MGSPVGGRDASCSTMATINTRTTTTFEGSTGCPSTNTTAPPSRQTTANATLKVTACLTSLSTSCFTSASAAAKASFPSENISISPNRAGTDSVRAVKSTIDEGYGEVREKKEKKGPIGSFRQGLRGVAGVFGRKDNDSGGVEKKSQLRAPCGVKSKLHAGPSTELTTSPAPEGEQRGAPSVDKPHPPPPTDCDEEEEEKGMGKAVKGK